MNVEFEGDAPFPIDKRPPLLFPYDLPRDCDHEQRTRALRVTSWLWERPRSWQVAHGEWQTEREAEKQAWEDEQRDRRGLPIPSREPPAEVAVWSDANETLPMGIEVREGLASFLEIAMNIPKEPSATRTARWVEEHVERAQRSEKNSGLANEEDDTEVLDDWEITEEEESDEHTATVVNPPVEIAVPWHTGPTSSVSYPQVENVLPPDPIPPKPRLGAWARLRGFWQRR